MAAIPTPVETLTDTVEMTVMPGPAPIETLVDSVTATIEAILNAVALAVEAHGAAFVAVRLGTIRQHVEPAIDALTASVEVAVDTVATTVEMSFDAIAAPIESILDAVAEIGQRRR